MQLALMQLKISAQTHTTHTHTVWMVITKATTMETTAITVTLERNLFECALEIPLQFNCDKWTTTKVNQMFVILFHCQRNVVSPNIAYLMAIPVSYTHEYVSFFIIQLSEWLTTAREERAREQNKIAVNRHHCWAFGVVHVWFPSLLFT